MRITATKCLILFTGLALLLSGCGRVPLVPVL